MQNITQLRKELSKVFLDLKEGHLDPAKAVQMNNSAGKILGTLNVQLKYSDLRKEKPDIDYLNG